MSSHLRDRLVVVAGTVEVDGIVDVEREVPSDSAGLVVEAEDDELPSGGGDGVIVEVEDVAVLSFIGVLDENNGVVASVDISVVDSVASASVEVLSSIDEEVVATRTSSPSSPASSSSSPSSSTSSPLEGVVKAVSSSTSASRLSSSVFSPSSLKFDSKVLLCMASGAPEVSS